MEKKNEDYEGSRYSEFVRRYFWMIRPCEQYEIEKNECTSIRGRFHQYFIHGSFTDCSEWRRNIKRCDLCISEFNSHACEEIIESERVRKLKRLKAHLDNDVWKKRDKPPEDWVKPLPEWWDEEKKGSYFVQQAENFEKDSKNLKILKTRFCRIA